MTSELTAEKDLTTAVRISWLGHSMFLLEDGAGHRLVTDPYDDHVGYALPAVEADIVLISHDHADHSNLDLVKGDPVAVRTASPREIDGISIAGFPTWHDPRQGDERGPNIVYRIGMQGLTFVHLGDLGHPLDAGLEKELAGADVLFIPVGGFYTIDAGTAARVVEGLKPRIAIPMHFKNAACGFPIDTEQPFVSRFDRVERSGKSPVYVTAGDAGEGTLILVMDYL